MSTCIRSMPSIRAAQSFSATGSLTQPVRRLHITGAKDSPSHLLKLSGASASASKSSKSSRTFNTSRALKRPGDTSTIDFAFLPDAASLQPGMISTAAMNIPILPDNYRASSPRVTVLTRSNAAEDIAPEVQTVSMNVPGTVAVLSEIDGATHEGREMDVYKIVEHVSKSVAGSVREVVDNVTPKVGVVREVWEGMLGDLINPTPRTA